MAVKSPRTLLALAVAVALPASGADLLSVYRDALVADPVYQAARAQFNATSERLPQARSGYLPFINANVGITRHWIDRAGTPSIDYTYKTYSVTLSQPIFRLQNWIAITQAQKVVFQAEATLAQSQQELAIRAAQAYFDVLLARDNVAFSESQKAAIDQQLAQARRNFEVGTVTIVDTLEAQARFDQAVAKEITDKSDLEVKTRSLTVILGKMPDGLVPLREPLPLSPPTPNDVEAWVTSANDSSFTVAIARAGYAIAKQEIDRQRAGHLPTLDLNGTAARVNDPTSAAPPISRIANLGSVGITLSVPIFSGGVTQSRVREAVALRDRAEQELENAQRTVAQTVRAGFLVVTSGIAQVRALEQALTSTQSQLESTLLGRDVGVRTSVDVLNAQQQVVQTRRDLQQARYNFLLNSLRLRAATGQLIEADIEALNRALARG